MFIHIVLYYLNDRTLKDLKKKYQNLLNIAKTKERQNKVIRRKTCGEPSEELPLSTVEQILSI